MKLGHVQRFVAALTALGVVAGAPSLAFAGEEEFAPAKGKDKGKKDEAAVAEEAPAPEPEPEPVVEPEPEPEPEDEDEDEVAAATTSAAPGMKGRIGLGGTRSLSGVNAISLRYYPIDKLDIGALIGFATFSHRDVGDDGEFSERRTVGLLGAGLHLFYWPVQGDRSKIVSADFGFGMRGVVYVGFDGDPEDNPEVLEGPLEIDIEIPMTTHLFIGDSVAITPEFGFVARIIPGNREPDDLGNADTNPGSGAGSRLGTTDGPGLGFEIGEHGGVFFGLSISYFFGGKKAEKKGKKKKS